MTDTASFNFTNTVALCGRVWMASIATARKAGPLPELAKDAPAHVAKWFKLMRLHDPRLQRLSDDDIAVLLNVDDD
jgi:hypothetical protein